MSEGNVTNGSACKVEPAKIKKVTFWQQYRRKPMGMVGLGIVVLYVLIALAAPLVAKYDPMKDLFLADNLAAPTWMRSLSQKYRNAPPTITSTTGFEEWTVTQGVEYPFTSTSYDDKDYLLVELPAASSSGSEDPMMEILKEIYTEEEIAEMFGAQPAKSSFAMEYKFPYSFDPPNTFTFTFDYAVEGSSPDSITDARLLVITPSGKEYDVWGMEAYGDWPVSYVTIDGRDVPVKMRLGMDFFSDPAKEILSEKGEYTIKFMASTDSATGAKLYITPVKFNIPGLVHGILGTDHMGSDLWAQLIYGARISLLIGLTAAFISVILGTAVGIISGYIGGAVDEVLMRFVDVLLAIPSLPILIVLSALLGTSVWNVVILVAMFSWMGTARLVRSQTLTLKERPFVEAAKASGATDGYVMITHILPNVMPLVFSALVLRIPSAILTEASLSFLGLGDPRVPTWGRMLQNARGFGAFTVMAWWWLLPPGLALTILSLAFVFIGNTINEILNPRYRERS